jgi:hypothetical protein
MELSHGSTYNFSTQSVPFRFFLKVLTSFLISDHRRGSPLPLDETSALINDLLTSKNNLEDREQIISSSASFIMALRYLGDPLRPDKATDDYREAFALAIRHDIGESLLSEFSTLENHPDFAALNVDLLASPAFDTVITYFISSTDGLRRKADVAMVMLTEGLTADEAITRLDIGARAERVNRWAQFTPGNTDLSSFNQMLWLEDALADVLTDSNVSLLDAMGAPLRAFCRQDFPADQSFRSLVRILRNWHSDPLGQFFLYDVLKANDERARRSARHSVEEFPTDFVTRMARDGIDPQDAAALLQGPFVFGPSLPAPPKYAVSILQATNGTLTPAKLEELVPYLNVSRLAPTLLISIAESFLNGEGQLADLEKQVSSTIGTMSADAQHSLNIETALCDLLGTNDITLVSLDLETAEMSFTRRISTDVYDEIGDYDISGRDHAAVFETWFGPSGYTDFSATNNFSIQLPGQARRQSRDDVFGISSGRGMLPPGTAIQTNFTDTNGEARNVMFRLPLNRTRSEG